MNKVLKHPPVPTLPQHIEVTYRRITLYHSIIKLQVHDVLLSVLKRYQLNPTFISRVTHVTHSSLKIGTLSPWSHMINRYIFQCGRFKSKHHSLPTKPIPTSSQRRKEQHNADDILSSQCTLCRC